MASIYLGLNRGTQFGLAPDEVAEGTSTNSTDMECRFDETKGLTAKDVQLFLRIMQNWIADGRLNQYFH